MAKSQNSFIKKEKEKKKLKKKQEKQQRKEERKSNAQDSSLESMIAYVDDYGNITSVKPTGETEKVDASSIEIGVKRGIKEPEEPKQGKVSFFEKSKGYGFIEQDGSKERFFIHMNNLEEPIAEGDKVSFKSRKGLKGMEAYEVMIVKKA